MVGILEIGESEISSSGKYPPDCARLLDKILLARGAWFSSHSNISFATGGGGSDIWSAKTNGVVSIILVKVTMSYPQSVHL